MNPGEILALQLENRQLRADLAAAQQQVQRLTAKLAHDLRAPLRHIGAFVQVIEEDHGAQLGAGVSEHLRTIRQAALEMSVMLDDLLS